MSNVLWSKLILIERPYRFIRNNCLPVVFKLHESISVLDDNIPDAAVTLEESFDIAITNIVRDITDVNALASHCHKTSLKEKNKSMSLLDLVKPNKLLKQIFLKNCVKNKFIFY